MTTPSPSALPTPSASGRPATWTLVRWVAVVLAVHLGVLMGMAGTLDWRLQSPQVIRTGPLQTRWLAPPVTPQTGSATTAAKPAPPQTRVAQVAKTTPPAAAPEPAPSTEPLTPTNISDAALAQASEAAPAQASAPQATASEPVTATAPAAAEPRGPIATETAAPATPSSAPEPASATAALDTTTSPAPERIADATMDLPPVSLAALPPSAVLSYRLNGQEKGLNYHATGELRWQHNDNDYTVSLSVKAFLVGSRVWRSQGQITSAGLTPLKFSDSWRSERAAHFDRAQKRIVFSSNAPTATLQAGAQDQISLYVQLAAAMAGSGSGLKQGARLQIQTATVRDALPWRLTLDQIETLTIDGQALQATKWVCQPRNRFDAKVEFWVTAEHHWMPVRIRITQVNGSFIDLNLSGREPLPPLPS